MKHRQSLDMTQALALMRSGDLTGASGLIQEMLGARSAGAPTPAIHGKKRHRQATESRANPVPDRPAPMRPGRYTGPSGSLDYLLYVPAGARAGSSLPLVIMLHGCTQTPEDFARGTGMNAIADELGLLVAYPRQPQSANAQRCWNWFRPDDQQRGRGEPALIAGATRQILAEHGGDPARTYVAGLSAGGAAAAILASAYPDLYAAVGVHSGLACGAARDLPSALAAMRTGRAVGQRGDDPFVPVITFHGDADTTVSEANSAAIVARAETAFPGGVTNAVSTGRSPNGQSYSRMIATDAAGRAMIERWTLHGAGHAWSGGAPGASYVDPEGPDASREMVRFFLTHRMER